MRWSCFSLSVPSWATFMLFAGAMPWLAVPQVLAQEEASPAEEDVPQPSDQPQALPAVGYPDGPFLPDSPWRVHDLFRPRPRVVAPGPAVAPVGPPSDAMVLFDGSDLSQWVKPGASPGELLPAPWKIADGILEVVPHSGSIHTIENFGDCQIHLEWSAPNPPSGSSQGRGNSGVIIMGRYEIQVLDSYKNVTYADGQAASIYGQAPPMVNVTRPPGEWNVYDIVFEAPVFEGDKLIKPAHVTLFHNGVLVQYHRPLLGAVAHQSLARYSPHPPAGPLLLQDHGNPTRFRNIWVRPLALRDAAR